MPGDVVGQGVPEKRFESMAVRSGQRGGNGDGFQVGRRLRSGDTLSRSFRFCWADIAVCFASIARRSRCVENCSNRPVFFRTQAAGRGAPKATERGEGEHLFASEEIEATAHVPSIDLGVARENFAQCPNAREIIVHQQFQAALTVRRRFLVFDRHWRERTAIRQSAHFLHQASQRVVNHRSQHFGPDHGARLSGAWGSLSQQRFPACLDYRPQGLEAG